MPKRRDINHESVKSQKRSNNAKNEKQNATKAPEKQKDSKTAIQRMQEVQMKNAEKAKEFVNCDSSSEEEELNGDELLNGVFKSYIGERSQLIKTQNILEETFQSGSAICLICIGTVKRTDGIWSCSLCFCFFHLHCIKKWANDSIFQQKSNSNEVQRYYNNSGELVIKIPKPIKWCCPKCRAEYDPQEIPKAYLCFCENEVNPPYHPWLLPHSCGETCNKLLKPECGHKCLLLCHPGPCPPCPQNITTSCMCGKSQKETIRCFQKSWNCNSKCTELLKCGIHKCEQKCHKKGYCPPCTSRSIQKCLCGNEAIEKKCSESIWQCKKVCNRLLSCGRHKCKIVCHSGDCDECPMGLPRACPCGKTKTIAPCSEIIEPCGDTCQKALPCGLHFCAQRCHKGDCSLCLTIAEKKCRCGLYTKELPCSKIFTCETKCKYMRDCGKHVCNKKCCDGQCPPCDKICSKLLSCRKHKCKSICHDGPCYPCELKSQLKCRCGSSSITVPCGRERKTRPPKCKLPCKFPSKCHHNNPHQCHMNECPPCVQKCNLKNDVTNCIHPCQAKCHSAVKVLNIERNQNAGNIWEWHTEIYEIKCLPHPKCEVKVKVACIGGHDRELRPCSDSKARSCGRLCGRILKCGNHKCELLCHTVPNINITEAQDGCMKCELGCEIIRPNGCIHPCRKPCHLPPCLPCSLTIKANCHCGLTQIYYKCSEFYPSNFDEIALNVIQEKLRSCGNPCIKRFPCGHNCSTICHSGICPNPESCRKKVKVYCACKNLKTETTCDKYRMGLQDIPCNDKCMLKKKKEETLKLEEEIKRKLLEEERNRLELEQFEKKFGKKKPRERKQIHATKEINHNFKLWILCGVFVATMSVISIVYAFQFQ